ncbi:hypothetical protein ACFL27_10120 [candidate division CSSED10-310 bacterium]|uniref:DUF2079 domain-containing protein n=1 Tax=candidate division CSSED10-310 bacterium TaxID=2855610 RepID=A0ABV6YWF3_UNCC1
MQKYMNPQLLKIFGCGVLFLSFFYLVSSPPKRIILADGFSSLVLGELWKKEPGAISVPNVKRFQEHHFRILKKRMTIRLEKMPIPKELQSEKKRQTTIQAANLSFVPGKSQHYYLPQSLNLNIVFALLYALGVEHLYHVLVVLFLLICFLKVLPVHYFRGHWMLVMTLIIFNPLFLFYSYHSASLDIANMLIVCFLVALFLNIWHSLSLESKSKKSILLPSIIFGCGNAVSLWGNPLNICLTIFMMCGFLMHPQREAKTARTVLMMVLISYSLSLIVFGLALIAAVGSGKPVLMCHPLFENFSSWFSDHSGMTGVVILSTLTTNLYLILRAIVLSFPLLLPAFFGFFSFPLREPIFRLMGGIFCILLVPNFFITDLEFSHYLLTGRLLLPLLPVLAILATHWLSQRALGERVCYTAFIILIGFASYAFFMARLRIDLFDLGLLEALDKNFTRIYLVHQYTDLFP